jgi:hypothetical protein
MTEEMQGEITSEPSSSPTPQINNLQNQRKRMVLIGVGGVLLLAILIVGIYFLSTTGPDITGRIRDIFIILMALVSIVIGLALIILTVQLATLINLIQNEIKPILNSTNETVSTLRGTATFLSDNLVEPVIKFNEYLAGLKRIVEILKLIK